MRYYYKHMDSPVGELTLIGSTKGLAALLWEDDDPDRIRVRAEIRDEHFPVLVEAEKQLEEYFEGTRVHFDLPLDPMGTDFQKQVWKALETIPYGKTRRYLEIAQQIGKPAAVRAVGAANGKNPISIIIPCHRVIGSSGSLTGFAGGLEAKASLLSIENGKNNIEQLALDLADATI